MLLMMVSFFLTVFGALIAMATIAMVFHSMFRETKFKVLGHYRAEPLCDLYAAAKAKGTFFTSDPTECVDIAFTKKGIGSEGASPPLTVVDLATGCFSKMPDSPFLSKEYKDSRGRYEWEAMSRREVLSAIKAAARGFIALGLRRSESVCIMGFNCPRWHIADLAAIFAGGLAVGLYATNNEGQCRYIVNDCNAKIVVLENEKLLRLFLGILLWSKLSECGRALSLVCRL